MSKSKQHKPGGKSGQRTAKLDPPQAQTSDHAPDQSLKPATLDAIKPIEAAVASPAVMASTDALPVRGAAQANTPSIDFQTIAMAYGDYTKKSFEQTKAFVEKLAGVRSLDKAIEIQTEFARQACETFVQESQKIRELYSVLARQTFEDVVAQAIPAAR